MKGVAIMFMFKLYRANRAVQLLKPELVQQGYHTGYHGLPDHSREWIQAHVHRIAQSVSANLGTSTALQAQMGRVEDRAAKARSAVRAMRAQLELRPPVLTRTRLHFSVWAASRTAGRLERQLKQLAGKLDAILAQEDVLAGWSAHQIAALQQTYLAAFYPAKKSREYLAQLDSMAPPDEASPMPAKPLHTDSADINGTPYHAESMEDTFATTTYR
jgi:hypothetical protein